MQLTKIAGVALALLMVTGTAAAMPGSPVAQADETRSNDAADAADRDPAGNDSEVAAGGSAGNDSDAADRGGAGAARGPPADLPDQVPSFVGDIHQLVQQHLDSPLGERISDLTPGDDEESDDVDESDADEATDAEASDDVDDDPDADEATDDADADDGTTESKPTPTDA